MVTYHIRYEAENHYDHEVHEALFDFLVLPCQDSTQDVVEEQIDNSLHLPMFRTKNVFGYHTLSVRVAQPFRNFKIQVACKVRKATTGIIRSPSESLPLEEELKLLQSEAFRVDYYLYIRQTALTDILSGSIPEKLLYRQDVSLFAYLMHLNSEIYQLMRYQAGVTTTTTKAREVLANPCGVCQDYSHLMLGILRLQQLPARYVSGYLNQGQQLMGSMQMHAWIEAYIPAIGWVGFDPTNNLMADQHYIKVADGTDYQDCSPLKGFIKPAVVNSTGHNVQVVEQ